PAGRWRRRAGAVLGGDRVFGVSGAKGHPPGPVRPGADPYRIEQMRSCRPGMPRRTRSHWPSRSTRYSEKAHGTPFAVSGSAESINWKCRCGAVEFPVWPTRPIICPARTSCPVVTATLPGARCAYRAYARPRPNDHVIPGQPRRITPPPRQPEHQHVLQRGPELTRDVNPLPLRHTIYGLDDHASERRIDRLPPSVAIPRPSAD